MISRVVETGRLERANPLPPGRYWIDVFGDDIPKFDQWLDGNRALGLVAVESSEHFQAQMWYPPFQDERPARNWILFKVLGHVPWNGVEFGYPTIADAGVQYSSDTADRPEPEFGASRVVERIILVSLGAASALGVLWLATYLRGGPR